MNVEVCYVQDPSHAPPVSKKKTAKPPKAIKLRKKDEEEHLVELETVKLDFNQMDTDVFGSRPAKPIAKPRAREEIVILDDSDEEPPLRLQKRLGTVSGDVQPQKRMRVEVVITSPRKQKLSAIKSKGASRPVKTAPAQQCSTPEEL